jgi:energy-coupling factor transporter ATP-binding protein EcfA2
MAHIIQLVPAIKRLSLTRVGCWNQLILDFIPSLNIITGMGGCGKSTILRSILQAVHPLDPGQYCLTPTHPFTSGRIDIEFYTQSVVVDIPLMNRIPEEPALNESHGQFMLAQLRSYITEAPKNALLLIEDEVTAVLDEPTYVEAVKVLNAAQCQVICLIAHRLDPIDFKHARVYVCSLDRDNSLEVTLQQSGRADGYSPLSQRFEPRRDRDDV